jgi:hypothetical protein
LFIAAVPGFQFKIEEALKWDAHLGMPPVIDHDMLNAMEFERSFGV